MLYKNLILVAVMLGSVGVTYVGNTSYDLFGETMFEAELWDLSIPEETTNSNYNLPDVLNDEDENYENQSRPKKIDYRVAKLPPLSSGRVIGQVASGTLGSVLFFAGGFRIRACGSSDGLDCLAPKLLAGIIAAPLGAAVGTFFVGNTKIVKGSFFSLFRKIYGSIPALEVSPSYEIVLFPAFHTA